jgi:hypothetical protein
MTDGSYQGHVLLHPIQGRVKGMFFGIERERWGHIDCNLCYLIFDRSPSTPLAIRFVAPSQLLSYSRSM